MVRGGREANPSMMTLAKETLYLFVKLWGNYNIQLFYVLVIKALSKLLNLIEIKVFIS